MKMWRFYQILIVALISSCAVVAKPTANSDSDRHNQHNDIIPDTSHSHSGELEQIPEIQALSNENETLIIKHDDPHSESESHGVTIQRLHAQCSRLGGLVITAEFSAPFNGVIYSDKHFSNRKCRYLEANSGRQTLTFIVPIGGCGTIHDVSTRNIQNIIIFQMDEIVQEKWDVAQRISCEYSEQQKEKKMVFFKPLSLGMLEVTDRKFVDDFHGLSSTMDIQKGIFPNMSPINNDGEVETGDNLSILITLKDDANQYGMSVKDCWALDSENDDSRASKIQLTGSFDGCIVRSKRMSNWRSVHINDTNNANGQTLMSYANLTAFKFPRSDYVHLTCNIEVCRGPCEEEICQPKETELISTQSHPLY